MNFDFMPKYFMRIYAAVENPKLWVMITGISLFISKYVFSQWAFAIGFFIIFIMDTISGSYIAWRTGTFEGKKFRDMLMDKCIAYFAIIISFSAGTKIALEESNVNLIQYMNLPFYSLFIGVELNSIFKKWYAFKKWDWLGKLIELFDKDKKEAKNEDQ
jgi:hypothetical protein